jgi:hypothetical protein
MPDALGSFGGFMAWVFFWGAVFFGFSMLIGWAFT